LRLASEQAISKGQDLPLSVGQQFQHPLYITGKLPVAQKAPCSAKGRLADIKEAPFTSLANCLYHTRQRLQ